MEVAFLCLTLANISERKSDGVNCSGQMRKRHIDNTAKGVISEFLAMYKSLLQDIYRPRLRYSSNSPHPCMSILLFCLLLRSSYLDSNTRPPCSGSWLAVPPTSLYATSGAHGGVYHWDQGVSLSWETSSSCAASNCSIS